MTEDRPQAGDDPVENVPTLADAVGDVPPRPDGVRGSLERLLEPSRQLARVRASRRHGVGALLPPLSETGVMALGDVPEGYRPGGYIRGENDWPIERLREVWEADADRREAYERVLEYLVGIVGFYGDEEPPEVVDTVDGSPDAPALLLSDLRLLFEMP